MMRDSKRWFGIIAVIAFCLAVTGVSQAEWPERFKAIASDGVDGDSFGISVSIDGDCAIIGASGDDDNGSTYIFKRNGTDWIQQTKLLASDGAVGDSFGCSVAIDGNYAIVGAHLDDDTQDRSGSAYIFFFDGVNWTQQAKLVASDPCYMNYFGSSVSIWADYALIGADGGYGVSSHTGSAYVFKRDGSTWTQQAKLFANDCDIWDSFGESVSIYGDYAVIGTPLYDSEEINTGAVYVYNRNGTEWPLQTKLTVSNTDSDNFGESVSIDTNYIAIGTMFGDGNEINTGSVYIYKLDGGNWTQQQKLTASDGQTQDYFGQVVCLDGNDLIMGASGDGDNGLSSGSAYIFSRVGQTWVEQAKLLASEGDLLDYFGIAVAISNGWAIAGAYGDEDNGPQSGSAYLFEAIETGTLTLLDPNGGEVLVAGATCQVNWQTQGSVADVYIDYSTDSGLQWTPVDTIANSGSYDWLIPPVNSDQCLLRISDAAYAPTNDISDDVFRIYVCTLNYDFNHDCFVDFSDFGLFASEWLRCGDPCDPDCVPE